MRLPLDLREQLQAAYKQSYGRELSPEDADELGWAFLEFFGGLATDIERHGSDPL